MKEPKQQATNPPKETQAKTKSQSGRSGGEVRKRIAPQKLKSETAMHLRWSPQEKQLIRKVAEALGTDMIDVVRIGAMKFVNESIISGKVEVEIGHLLRGDPDGRFKE